MKRFLSIGILLLIVHSLFADETDFAGDDPDIILPPMFLEIEDVTKEDVKTALPGVQNEEPIILPELMTPMPDPTETEFDETQIDAFLSTIGGENALADEEKKREKRLIPISLDAHAGLGTVGELDLGFGIFGNTKNSTFRFDGSHCSHDGYGFRPWGGVFFDSNTLFFGQYAFRRQAFANETEASFQARDFGTQNLTAENDARRDLYFSVADRFSLEAGALRFEAAAAFDLGHRYTTDVGNGVTDLFLQPKAVLDLLLPQTKLTFSVAYGWNGSLFASDHGHSADFLFEFDAELPQAVNFAGGVGLFWDGRETESVYDADLRGFSIPFYVSIYGTAAEFFQYRFKGGFENEYRSYAALSRDFCFLEPTSLSALSGWFAEAELDFRIRRLARISVGLDFNRKSGTVTTDELKVNTSGLISTSQRIENLLFAFLRTEIRPTDGLEVTAGWEGSLLPDVHYYLKPRHRIDAHLSYTIPRKWFTFDTYLQFDYYDKAYIPEWNLNAFFEINDHFRLALALNDLLSPIYKEGRPTVWGEYTAPGFGASVRFEIKY